MQAAIGGTLRCRRFRSARKSRKRMPTTSRRAKCSASASEGCRVGADGGYRQDPLCDTQTVPRSSDPAPRHPHPTELPTMPIRIGANPIGWSNDDMPELGGKTPLETCLAEAKDVGFEGMELGNKFPRQAERLKAALAPFGLACIGGWHSIELLTRSAEAEFEAARAHVELLKAMGTPVFIVAETSNAIHGNRAKPLSQRPVLQDAEWAEYGRKM